MDYTIRFATKEDTDALMHFIDEYWRKNHILSRDRELFLWQYGNSTERLNIVIGIDEEKRIQGMLGFVPYDTGDNKDFALALWKANPGTGFLGIKLLKYLMEEEPHREIVCPGINMDTTSKIYEHVGMKVGNMTQWYRLSPRDSYVIGKIEDNSIPKIANYNKTIRFSKINNIEELRDLLKDYKGTPHKSIEYLNKRYFIHPRYAYIPYGVTNETDNTVAALMLRIQEYGGSRILRLIDCIGDVENLRYITDRIDDLLVELNCEYIDCYEAGIDDEIMTEAGWRRVEEGGNIIPDYFAPFEHRKVDIHYATSSPAAILFKGDGDQDRPN